jgi:ParB family chromosome partitioning protein
MRSRARSRRASTSPGERACAFHDHLGRLLGIDVARWWRPTGANYFDRVPKSMALAALAEVGGPTLAGRYAKAKKAELAQSCERIFSGDFIAEVEVKEAALAWVPEAMRFARAGSGRFGGPRDRHRGDGALDGTAQTGQDGLAAPAVEEIEEAA